MPGRVLLEEQREAKSSSSPTPNAVLILRHFVGDGGTDCRRRLVRTRCPEVSTPVEMVRAMAGACTDFRRGVLGEESDGAAALEATDSASLPRGRLLESTAFPPTPCMGTRSNEVPTVAITASPS